MITAGNFPVAVPAWYIVPALLAGNPVVWKPAEYSAVSSARVSRALRPRRRSAGRRFQHRVMLMAPRPSRGSSKSLEAGLIDKVGFTGSSVGRPGDRRLDRAPPADCMPGAGRQESADRHTER